MNNEEIAVRIVDIDYELCRPIDNFDICLSAYSGNAMYRVPVIRIFGILNNANADKCCLWIHRVFPYLLVPFYPPNKQRINEMTDEQLNAYLTSFGAQIESIINSVSKKAVQTIYALSVVHAIDFYGYHSSQEAFIKISLIDPKQLKRVVLILESGVINDCVYQPYESHIPYLLHFLIDFNLYGMNFVHCRNPQFRQPLPSNHSVPIHLLSSRQIKKRSLCKFEIDAIAQNIVNVEWIQKIKIMDAPIERIKLVPSLNEIWQKYKKNEEAQKTQKRIAEKLPTNRIESKYEKILESLLENANNRKREAVIRQRGKLYADDLNVIMLQSKCDSMTQSQNDDEEMLHILADLDCGSVIETQIIPQNAGNLTAALAVLYVCKLHRLCMK